MSTGGCEPGLILLATATAMERDAALRGVSDTDRSRIFPLVCGVGPLAAALSLALALSRGLPEGGAGSGPENGPQYEKTHRPAGVWRGVLHVGYAGSYDALAAPVGSCLLAGAECFPEYGVWPEPDEAVPGPDGRPGARGRPLPLPFAQGRTMAGEDVFTHILLNPEEELGNMGLTCHSDLRQGLLATLSGVSGTPARARRMAGLTGALAEAMEGFALALTARTCGLPFAELRAISNLAGRRPPDTWDRQAADAALARGMALLFRAPC